MKNTVKSLAEEITKRLVERAVRLQFTRNNLELATEEGDDEPMFNEDEMVRDALNLALGDDTGCLGDEDITPENIDVLFVEEQLKTLQKRCLHDCMNLLMNSIKDTQPTDDPREVLRCLAVAVNETGPGDFGVGECSCTRNDCPY